jgi:hypothetical protein
MRRLSIFALALFLALVGVQLVIGPELFASYVVRDAALLWVGAAVAGARFAATWRPRAPQRWVSEPPRIGRLLLYTGIAVALAAGLAQGFLAGSPLALMLQFAWWLGLALLLIGAWWPGGRVEYAAPPVHWRRDAAGAFVPQAYGVDVATAPRLRRSSEFVWLAAILLCAALLRFWDLANLPPGCTGSECVNGLRLVEGEAIAGADSLFEQGARLVFWVTGNGVLSLRLTAGLFSLLTVVALWAAARRLAGAPAALLVALFVSFSPLQLWAARSSDPWVAVGLLVALALWWTAEALVQRTLRWWVLAGLGLAALFVQAPPLRGATLLWLAAVAAIALVHVWRRPHRGDWAAIAAGMAAALSLALPTLFAGNAVDPLWGAATLPQTANNLALLAATLLRTDSAGLPAGAELGLLSGLALALAVVGVGALTRHVRVATAAGLLAGLLLFAWFGARLDGAFFPPTQVALALLPFVFAAAAVALDQFLTVLVQTWRSVVAPQRLVAAVALAIGLVVVWNAAGFMAGLDQVATGGGQTEGDMARFVAQLRLSEPDAELTFILPSAATTHPSLRLLAGPALAAGRILPLESARTLPFAAEPPGDLLYLLPIADGQVLRVLQQLYPSGVAFTELDQAGERAIFNAFRVPRAAVQAARQVYVQIATPDNPAAASFGAPALDFAWRANPPAPAPFVAQATSALIVPETGVYTIAAERSAPLSGLLLTLDDMLVLDTALNLTSQQLQLVQGVYTLALTYRSGEEPGDLRITWQRPDGAAETIGGAALHWPPPPRQGLVASYYANAQFSGHPACSARSWWSAPTRRRRCPTASTGAASWPRRAPANICWAWPASVCCRPASTISSCSTTAACAAPPRQLPTPAMWRVWSTCPVAGAGSTCALRPRQPRAGCGCSGSRPAGTPANWTAPISCPLRRTSPPATSRCRRRRPWRTRGWVTISLPSTAPAPPGSRSSASLPPTWRPSPWRRFGPTGGLRRGGEPVEPAARVGLRPGHAAALRGRHRQPARGDHHGGWRARRCDHE